MITKHDDLLGTLIHDVAHLLRLDIDQRLRIHNLTRVKWLALGIIRHNPGITQSELADELELGNASVGRLVDRLVDRGFLLRDRTPDDRRSYQLTLTPQTKILMRELDRTAQEIRAENLAPLKEKEISVLNSALHKLKKNLKSRASESVIIVFFCMQKLSTNLEILSEFGSTL